MMESVVQLLGTDFYYAEKDNEVHWTSRSHAMVLDKEALEDLIVHHTIDPSWLNHGLKPEDGASLPVEIIVHEDVSPDKRPGAKARQAEAYNQYLNLATALGRDMGRTRDQAMLFQTKAQDFLTTLIMEKWDDYDPSKASRSTWVWLKIHYHLRTLSTAFAKKLHKQKQNQRNNRSIEIPTTAPMLIDLLDINEDARTILNIVETDPDQMKKRFRLPEEHRKFQEHLVTEHGWSWDRVKVAWAKLEEMYGWSVIRKKQSERRKSVKARGTSLEQNHSRSGVCPRN